MSHKSWYYVQAEALRRAQEEKYFKAYQAGENCLGHESCGRCMDKLKFDRFFVPCWMKSKAIDAEIVTEPAPAIMLGCEIEPKG